MSWYRGCALLLSVWLSQGPLLAGQAEPAVGGFLVAANAGAEAEPGSPPAVIRGPARVRIGKPFTVAWSGPDRDGDYISIARAMDRVGRLYSRATTLAGDPATLRAPDYPGVYELRYVEGSSRRILARARIQVVDVGAELQAPSQALAGETLEVAWSGPDGAGDRIDLVRKGDAKRGSAGHADTRDGSPARIKSPDAPGIYQIRYVTGQARRVLAQRSIRLVRAGIELRAPDRVDMGSELAVEWQGPDGRGDFINLVARDAGEAKLGSYAHTRKGSPARLIAPDSPGDYEIRYIDGRQRRLLASRPLQVARVEATVAAAEQASIGESVPVEWTGPDGHRDIITVVPGNAKEGRIGGYVPTRGGSPASLSMPEQPGEYEIRYVTGQQRRTLARHPIQVVAVASALEAAAESTIGAHVSVSWQGPGNRNDIIMVVPAGASERKSGNYVYTREGSPLRLLMPDRPGDYEIRYVTGKQREVLARRPIRVREVAATLEAPPVVAGDGRFEVSWSGPDGRRDYIGLSPVGGAAGRRSKYYVYTREGSPLDMRAPKEPGQYELRYVTGQSRRVLARRPLAVR